MTDMGVAEGVFFQFFRFSKYEREKLIVIIIEYIIIEEHSLYSNCTQCSIYTVCKIILTSVFAHLCWFKVTVCVSRYGFTI
jgi:hypothetical protein